MKQVIQSVRSGKLSLVDVPMPQAESGELLVRTNASLISAGTERMVVEFAQKSLLGKATARPDLVQKVITKVRRDGIFATFRSVRAQLDQPLPLGYSAAGTVSAVGAGLEGRFHVGQRVAMAGAGIANHAEFNVVPANLAAPIPDDVPDEEAAFATVAAIAMHGVRNLAPGLGDVIAVLGVGLVGQVAVQLLALSGTRVVAIDTYRHRLALALRLGAEAALSIADGGLAPAIMALSAGRGADGILITAASDDNGPFVTAAAIARDRAKVSLVGKIGTDFPFAEFMKKELSVIVSRSYGPGRYDSEFEQDGVKYPVGFVRWTEADNLAESLRLMSRRTRHRLDVASLITHRFAFDEAERAYQLVLGRGEPNLGVVLTYPPRGEPAPAPRFSAPVPRPAGSCRIGMIGAGNFARAVLLPLLRAESGVTLASVATGRSASAEFARQNFGFARASTDANDVLNDPDIDAVIVATPHGNHADLVARALAAGKHIFVEKPLALDRDQLNAVIAARAAAPGFFTVGFNRRFAPMSLSARAALQNRPGPRLITMRINAGPLARESWVAQASEGHGRVLGELCHFIDLARFFAGGDIESVQAVAAAGSGPADDVATTLRFGDGSIASIAYTGLGDPAYPKELIEIFAGGAVCRIEDFRELRRMVDGKSDQTKAIAQDKGHAAEIKAFVAAVKAGGPAPVDEGELIQTSLATIAVVESLRSGGAVPLGTGR